MILACDPGLSGAFCFYVPETGQMDVAKMPTTMQQIGRKKYKRRVIDEQEIFNIVTTFANAGALALFIEDVGGRPHQSASAAFNFGLGCGAVRMAAIANGMHFEAIPPAKWKAALQVPSDKDLSRDRASQLIPTHAHLWQKKSQDGLAEACMIALYVYRRNAGAPFDNKTVKDIEKKRQARRNAIFIDQARAADRARKTIIRSSDDPTLAASLF